MYFAELVKRLEEEAKSEHYSIASRARENLIWADAILALQKRVDELEAAKAGAEPVTDFDAGSGADVPKIPLTNSEPAA